MEKVITIDGKDINMRCTAATYIKYRTTFKEDLFTQLEQIAKNVGEGGSIPEGALGTLFQAAYVMMLQGNPGTKIEFEEWMDEFDLFGSINGIQGIFELLMNDQKTLEEPKKKKDQQSAE